MKWLDRLLGKPTLELLVDDMLARLRRHGCTEIRVEPGLLDIHCKAPDGSEHRLGLHNLLTEWGRAPRARRDGVVDRFLAGILSDRHEHPIPDTYAQARERLMPTVRNATQVALQFQDAAAQFGSEAKDPSASTPASRPLVSDLAVMLVCDMPNSMAILMRSQLEEWGVTFDEALADAIHNLRGLPENGGWRQIEPGLWSGVWGDDYESSRLLLPDLIHRLGVPEPVVLAPFRNSLLVCSARDIAGLGAMARVTQGALAIDSRWTSFRPLRVVDGRLEPFEPPEAVAPLFDRLATQHAADQYAFQKQLLDQQHQREQLDLFVANYQMMSRDDGPIRSLSVWTDGIDTLLPQTDLVALVAHDAEGQLQKQAVVTWSHLREFAGEQMTQVPGPLPRWRVRAFPAADRLAQLLAVTVL